MPKKKKVEEVAVEPVAESIPEPVVEPAVEPIAESLVSVVAMRPFKDGAFLHDFAKYGYPVQWKANEVRQLPARLYLKLNIRSGGNFTLKGK